MNLVPYTFEGTSLRDSNYFAWFQRGTVMLHPGVDPAMQPREHAAPLMVYKARKPAKYALHVRMLGNVQTQIDDLKALFDPYLAEDGNTADFGALICRDSADSDKEWLLDVTVLDFVELDGDEVVITILAPNPIWRANTPAITTMSLTTTGSTSAIVVAGNQPSPPVIRYTPTAAKAILGVDKYRRSVFIHNNNYYARSYIRYPVEITNGGWNTAAMINDTTRSNQLDGAITTSATTITIDTAVGGGLPVAGMGYVDTEQISWTSNSGTSLTGVTRGIGGTTAASHLDNAVIAYSHMMANGDDLRLEVNGANASYWFGTGSNNINQSTTKIWAVLDLLPPIYNYGGAIGTVYTLATAIAGSGAISTITLYSDSTSVIFNSNYYKYPESGYLMIGTEIFSYLGKNVSSGQFIGVTRAALGTSEQAHSVFDPVYCLSNVMWLIYGNGTATTRTTDDTYKPIIDLTSSNSTWTYSYFADSTGKRPIQWQPIISSTTAPAANRTTKTYTTSQDPLTDADPAAVAGFKVGSWLKGSKWAAETAVLGWTLSTPSRITTVTATGYKYRTSSAGWPTGKIGLSYNMSATPNFIWTESSPTTAGTWTALSTHSSVAINGTMGLYDISVINVGTVAAGADQYIAMEFTDFTAVFNSADLPSITFGSEVALGAAAYSLDVTITNNTSGEWIRLQAQIDINQTLEIDCENKTIKYLFDNSFIPCQFTKSSVRHDWLNLAVGSNTIQVDEAGLTGATLTITTRDRQS